MPVERVEAVEGFGTFSIGIFSTAPSLQASILSTPSIYSIISIGSMV